MGDSLVAGLVRACFVGGRLAEPVRQLPTPLLFCRLGFFF